MPARPLISDSITSMTMRSRVEYDFVRSDVRFIASTLAPFNVPQPRH